VLDYVLLHFLINTALALVSLLFSLALEYASRQVQANQVGLKLNRKKLASVFYADNVNLLDAGTHREQSSFISC
jgi:hypothetical protein